MDYRNCLFKQPSDSRRAKAWDGAESYGSYGVDQRWGDGEDQIWIVRGSIKTFWAREQVQKLILNMISQVGHDPE